MFENSSRGHVISLLPFSLHNTKSRSDAKSRTCVCGVVSSWHKCARSVTPSSGRVVTSSCLSGGNTRARRNLRIHLWELTLSESCSLRSKKLSMTAMACISFPSHSRCAGVSNGPNDDLCTGGVRASRQLPGTRMRETYKEEQTQHIHKMFLSEVKEGFGNQINLCRDRGLNPGPPAQESDTLPLDHQNPTIGCATYSESVWRGPVDVSGVRLLGLQPRLVQQHLQPGFSHHLLQSLLVPAGHKANNTLYHRYCGSKAILPYLNIRTHIKQFLWQTVLRSCWDCVVSLPFTLIGLCWDCAVSATVLLIVNCRHRSEENFWLRAHSCVNNVGMFRTHCQIVNKKLREGSPLAGRSRRRSVFVQEVPAARGFSFKVRMSGRILHDEMVYLTLSGGYSPFDKELLLIEPGTAPPKDVYCQEISVRFGRAGYPFGPWSQLSSVYKGNAR
uniref:(California timema) hypothetical protein n=1 Tax=Timema californicum TaxID=61474 RepID=A0A7R9JAY9_TIMCA|nr:unnamed protein product [Timema californicum]